MTGMWVESIAVDQENPQRVWTSHPQQELNRVLTNWSMIRIGSGALFGLGCTCPVKTGSQAGLLERPLGVHHLRMPAA